MHYRALIDHVKSAGQLGQDDEAERALRATLLTLGECGAPVDRLAPNLPPEVSGYLQGGWAGASDEAAHHQPAGRARGRRRPTRTEANEAERRLDARTSHRTAAARRDTGEAPPRTDRTDPERLRSADRGVWTTRERGGEGGGPLPSSAQGGAAGARGHHIRHRDHYQRAVVDEEPSPGAPLPTRAVLSTADIVERVAEREGGVSPRTAERHVRAVLAALATALDQALLRDVCANLPGLGPLMRRERPQA